MQHALPTGATAQGNASPPRRAQAQRVRCLPTQRGHSLRTQTMRKRYLPRESRTPSPKSARATDGLRTQQNMPA
eukprot:scaffold682215_cov61-Prasinocladus_malaysianus.AAC.1